MENEKPKSTFAKWFGIKKSSCCNVKVEEIKDEDEDDSEKRDKKAAQPGDNKKEN